MSSSDEPTLTHDKNITELLAFLQYANTFSDYPPQFIPPGRDNPNYVIPTRGDAPFVIVVVFLALATIVVLFRLWARKYMNAMKLGWDDFMCIIGLISTYCFSAIEIWTIKAGGVGLHIYDIKPSIIIYTYPFQITAITIYLFCATMIKVSITIFMLRICPPNDRVGRILILATFAFISITFIGSILNSFLSCQPYSAAWDLRIRLYDKWHCGEPWKELVAWNTVYAATDLWLVLFPLRFVHHLNMPRRKKAGLFLIFALGSSATVFSILKLSAIKQTYSSFDPNWYFPFIMIYTHLELTIGLMAASLPSLGFLILRLIPSKPNSRQSPEKSSRVRSFLSATIKMPFLSTLSWASLRKKDGGGKTAGHGSSALSADEKTWNEHEEVARERIQKFMLPPGVGPGAAALESNKDVFDEKPTMGRHATDNLVQAHHAQTKAAIHPRNPRRTFTNDTESAAEVDSFYEKKADKIDPNTKNMIFGLKSGRSNSRSGPGDEGYHSGSRQSPPNIHGGTSDTTPTATGDTVPTSGIDRGRDFDRDPSGFNFLHSRSPGDDSSAAPSFISPLASPGSGVETGRNAARRPGMQQRSGNSDSTLNLPIQFPSSSSIPRGRARER